MLTPWRPRRDTARPGWSDGVATQREEGSRRPRPLARAAFRRRPDGLVEPAAPRAPDNPDTAERREGRAAARRRRRPRTPGRSHIAPPPDARAHPRSGRPVARAGPP